MEGLNFALSNFINKIPTLSIKQLKILIAHVSSDSILIKNTAATIFKPVLIELTRQCLIALKSELAEKIKQKGK
jgi:hypothetical protein